MRTAVSESKTMPTEHCSRFRTNYADAQWHAPLEGDSPYWRSAFVNQWPGIKHIFAPLGCNMSARSGRDTEGTMSRRQAACTELGTSIQSLTCAKQDHGTDIAVVRATDGGRVLNDVDGFVTKDPGVALMAFTADCPTVVLFDPTQKVLGMVHSGWKGTCANVVARLLSTMVDQFNTDPTRALAAIGPCASDCCYEIKDDVGDMVKACPVDLQSVLREADGKLYLNLANMIAQQLASTGLPASNIALPTHCTICDDRFFSYRRQGLNAGQAALMVCMD